MLGYYDPDPSDGFFMIFVPNDKLSRRDMIVCDTSHKEFSRRIFTKTRIQKRVDKCKGRNRFITFTISWQRGKHVMNVNSSALRTLTSLPVGNDIVELLNKEGHTYGINSRADMRRYLKGKFTTPDCLLDKVMPILMDYIIRTTTLDMTLASADPEVDKEVIENAEKLIKRYAEIFAKPIEALIEADRRERKAKSTGEIEVAASMLEVDLEMLEVEGYSAIGA